MTFGRPLRRPAEALALAALAATFGVCGCRGGSAARSSGGGEAGAVQALLDRQQYDDAIAKLGDPADADGLYQLGAAWAGKARSAPLPTPDPSTPPGTTLWKPEERRAIECLERAIAARPDHAAAHQALAELMAPHALEKLQAQQGRPAARPAGLEGPDASADTVLQHFTKAVQSDTTGTSALDSLVAFATSAGRLVEADAAYQELVRRRREDPTLLVRYGDFLATTKLDPEAALVQYGQALMWRPDDRSTRQKVAEIHLRAAADLLARHEYAAADARLAQVRKAGPEPTSPAAARLRELEQVLRDIRGR